MWGYLTASCVMKIGLLRGAIENSKNSRCILLKKSKKKPQIVTHCFTETDWITYFDKTRALGRTRYVWYLRIPYLIG